MLQRNIWKINIMDFHQSFSLREGVESIWTSFVYLFLQLITNIHWKISLLKFAHQEKNKSLLIHWKNLNLKPRAAHPKWNYFSSCFCFIPCNAVIGGYQNQSLFLNVIDSSNFKDKLKFKSSASGFFSSFSL